MLCLCRTLWNASRKLPEYLFVPFQMLEADTSHQGYDQQSPPERFKPSEQTDQPRNRWVDPLVYWHKPQAVKPN